MDFIVKQGSTLFLKIVVWIASITAIGFYGVLLPYLMIKEGISDFLPMLIVMFLTLFPVFVALNQIYKLLSYIDNNKAFSNLSVKSLKYIKYSSTVASFLFALILPYMYWIAQLEDAPGIMLIGLVFTFAPIVIAVFAAVLEMLLKSAIEFKSENELTV